MEGTSRSVSKSLLGAVLFGTAGTAAALGPAGTDPSVLGFLRLFFGALALLAAVPFFGGSLGSFRKLIRRPGVWVMAVCAGAYQPLFFGATARTGVALSTLVAVSFTPVVAGLVGWMVFRERPARAWFLATSVAVFGLALRSAGDLEVGNLTGLLMAAAAGSSTGCYLNAAKIELRREGHPVEMPALAYLIGSALLIPIVWSGFATVEFRWSLLALALYLGVMTMALANALNIEGLRGLPPGPAATLMLADPLTATVLGVVVLGESLQMIAIIGLVLVMVGLVWQSKAQRGDAAPPVGSTLG